MKSAKKGRSAARREVAALRIESLAGGGRGVARLAGGAVVFVAGAAPGELVEAEIGGGKANEARVLRVLEASPDRVAPPCPFVAACGGCDWMHLSASAQERGHAAIVAAALARALPGVALPEIRAHAAPAPLGYRTRARLFARGERGRVTIGYRVEGSHALAAIDACLVLDATIAPLVGELARVLAGATGEGDARIARGEGGRPVVDVAWRGDLPAGVWAAIDAKIAGGAWAGARVALHGVSRPASFGDPRPWLAGADGAPLAIAPGGFAQPSDDGAARLARRVAELAEIHVEKRQPHLEEGQSEIEKGQSEIEKGQSDIEKGQSDIEKGQSDIEKGQSEIEKGQSDIEKGQLEMPHLAGSRAGAGTEPGAHRGVVELFAGSGTLSVLLAHTAPFTAVEIDAEAAACARQNLASRGLAGKVVAADADAFAIPSRTAVVVLDPPRTGAPGAARAIAASSARVVVYVACDPATLARDLAVIVPAGFAITHVETFELFPQTSHVETVVRLERARRASGAAAAPARGPRP